MVREKIVWQYVGRIAAGDTATFDPVPMVDYDYLRVYCSLHGSGRGTFFFRGATSLPAGYIEKDGLISEGEYYIGHNDSQCFTLSTIVSAELSATGADLSIIFQGIKYEPC
jgi:hypothetical protein